MRTTLSREQFNSPMISGEPLAPVTIAIHESVNGYGIGVRVFTINAEFACDHFLIEQIEAATPADAFDAAVDWVSMNIPLQLPG